MLLVFLKKEQLMFFFKLVPKNQQLFERQDVNSGAFWQSRALLLPLFNSSFPAPQYSCTKGTVTSWPHRLVAGEGLVYLQPVPKSLLPCDGCVCQNRFLQQPVLEYKQRFELARLL